MLGKQAQGPVMQVTATALGFEQWLILRKLPCFGLNADVKRLRERYDGLGDIAFAGHLDDADMQKSKCAGLDLPVVRLQCSAGCLMSALCGAAWLRSMAYAPLKGSIKQALVQVMRAVHNCFHVGPSEGRTGGLMLLALTHLVDARGQFCMRDVKDYLLNQLPAARGGKCSGAVVIYTADDLSVHTTAGLVKSFAVKGPGLDKPTPGDALQWIDEHREMGLACPVAFVSFALVKCSASIRTANRVITDMVVWMGPAGSEQTVASLYQLLGRAGGRAREVSSAAGV